MRLPLTLSLVLVTGIGWGLIAPTTRLAFTLDPRILDGASLTVARGTWTALAWLVPFVVLVARERRTIDRGAVLRALALGALWGPGVMGLFAIATQRTALAHVVFSVGLTPISASLFAIVVYGGTIDAPRRASLLLGACAVAVLGLERTAAHASLLGDLSLLGWIVAFGLYATVAVGAMQRHSPLFVAACANTVGGTMLAFGSVFVSRWREATLAVATRPDLAGPFFGEIVVLGGFVAPLAYSYALRRAPVPVVTGGSQYLSLATGTVAAIVLFKEPFGPATIVAGILLGLSLGLSLVPRRAAR
ncbi:MAG: EamA family transporter [Candidatus Eremiobacteraeota bacterium]|nr:EamA family transporter [Candidatus Eremiobacteraeota bacterium]